MNIQKLYFRVPYEIDDIIKVDDYKNNFKVIDIQHTYSCLFRKVLSIVFVLLDLQTKQEIKLEYNENTFHMIKQNND